ncbi:type IV pilus modification PilV family protein [Metabacillus schmidteae]|uniref:type IV pilus modification PilV family protein n=1 Tax=Metabacillus schmidteae TaxID=2730405 RepID=UPI00158EFA30|nr:prepilin-type N-terminal cleavage/methylation domain-containing protein [Metabacillus schmidteae]
MKNFVKYVKNENGVSLVEVLATILISSILLVVVYNVFHMGIKSYERIGIEMQLRDEADYIVSSIMKELYEAPIDSVESCGEDCITITHNTTLNVDKDFPSIITEEKLDVEKNITIKMDDSHVNLSFQGYTDEIPQRNLLNDKYLLFLEEDVGNEEKSKIEINECINNDNNEYTCEEGLINMVLHIQHKDFTKDSLISADPVKLESKFGF